VAEVSPEIQMPAMDAHRPQQHALVELVPLVVLVVAVAVLLVALATFDQIAAGPASIRQGGPPRVPGLDLGTGTDR